MPNTHRRHTSAFTLTEMLVVLGILVLLTGMLIPAIQAVQRSAKATQCNARLKEIGRSLQLYLNDYGDVMPLGATSNSLDTPMSAVTLEDASFLPLAGPPYGWFQPPETAPPVVVPGYVAPIPPVAFLFRRYMPVRQETWACPTWRTGPAGLFRTYQYVEVPTLNAPGVDQSAHSDIPVAANPLTGRALGRTEFRPGYQYMGGLEFIWSIRTTAPVQQNRRRYFHYDQFATRNLAGLNTSEIKTTRQESPSQIVTFADLSVMAHSKESADMWNANLYKLRGNYRANFLFLDGHVEMREFKTIQSYFKNLHAPILQRWGTPLQDELDAPDVYAPPPDELYQQQDIKLQ